MALNSSTLPGKTGKIKRVPLLLSCIVLLSLVFTASAASSSTTSSKSILKIAAQSYDFSRNPASTHITATPMLALLGLVYETLYFVNVNDGLFTPMLATSYQWNSDNTQVTFTIRQNVKWNDGMPFTANDVAFTFNLMKKYPAAMSACLEFPQECHRAGCPYCRDDLPESLSPRAGQHCRTCVYHPAAHLRQRWRPDAGISPIILLARAVTLTRYQTDIAVFDENPATGKLTR